MLVFKFSVTDQLIFDCAEKRLCFGVIPAGPFPVHTLNVAVLFQETAEILACIVYASVTMNQKAGRWFSSCTAFFRAWITECCSNESLKSHLTNRLGIQGDEHGQIMPLSSNLDVRKIRDPDIFGIGVVKFRLTRLGATGSVCTESVVCTNFFGYLQVRPNVYMCLATRV